MQHSTRCLPAGISLKVAGMRHVAAMASASERYSLSGPFRYVFIAVTVVIVGWYWLSRQAPFRTAARRGGWRLVLALLSSLGMLTFGISIELGQLVFGIIALVVTGLPGMFLVIESSRRDGKL